VLKDLRVGEVGGLLKDDAWETSLAAPVDLRGRDDAFACGVVEVLDEDVALPMMVIRKGVSEEACTVCGHFSPEVFRS
jgi:hypothetical protein